SFVLEAGEYEDGQVQVRQTDAAGNASEATSLGPMTHDQTARDAPTAGLENDTGTDGDGVTSDGTVNVTGLEEGATWEYSTDGGADWKDVEYGSSVLVEGDDDNGQEQVPGDDAA